MGLKQVGMAIIVLLVVFLICGFLYQYISSKIDELRFPPSGKLEDVGGYRLHINSSGVGGPSVVLDAGMGGCSLGWTLVQPEVSTFTRVCSYDRAGYAWSDKSPLERTSFNMAKELHTLLHNAKIPDPYILVGHSLGGANMLLFASLYPNETAGVILVDSVHEDYLDRLPPEPGENSLFTSILNHPKTKAFMASIGVYRFLGPSHFIQRIFRPF